MLARKRKIRSLLRRGRRARRARFPTCGVIRVAGYSVVWDLSFPPPLFPLKSTKRSAAAISRLYAIGGNARVAELAGINVKKVIVLTYVIGGICTTLAGIMMASRMGSGQPTMGASWSMDNITAIVIGGTSIKGGSGSITRSAMGVILLTMITNGLNTIGLNAYYQMVATAMILLVTVILNTRNK